MGLFSRKASASSARPRPSVSSEAQAASLRVRARRRLAGAIALVLAAVIVLPMLLDSEPKLIAPSVQVTVPGRDTPFEPNLTPITVAPPQADRLISPDGTDQTATQEAAASASVDNADPVTPKGADRATSQDAQTSLDKAAVSGNAQVDAPPAKTTDKPATADKPAPPVASTQRTDDGSKALALLEGRSSTPVVGAASGQSGSSGFVVQVAAYSTQADAQNMRNKLHGEGITNAFVESTTINGKSTYRLRVGPFGSRDAAQVAQTRLRTLGYPNGFIATQ